MKKAAVLLILLLLAAIGGIIFLYLTSNISVLYDNCIATDASTQPAYFDQIKAQLSGNTFVGMLFDHTEPESADQYQYLTYTVNITNNAFLDATTAEIRITPMKGDVLQIGDTEEHLLPAHKTSSISATILTAKDAQNVREATITWYIWGLPFSEKITLGR